MDNAVQEVKNRLDIAEVVGAYIKLQRAGANMRALCPFHAEKSPSFFVSPARQTWHCFGCSRGGDAFKFVQEIEGIEFGDALRQLAQRAGVELPAYSPRMAQEKSERARMQELTELACQFFEKQLSSAAGAAAKTYLQERGVTEESIAKWRLGWAPSRGDSLMEFLKTRQFQQNEIERSGLTVRSEGRSYDRFRSRIMFPVQDQNGNVIGFGGRVFGIKQAEGMAKYVNVPNTLLYDKSKVLYGLDKAKVECRRQDRCLLVEGYMDAIMVSQAGTENVVAASGTALTQQHLNILKRFSQNLTLAFDMDSAGDAATKRGIDMALNQGFSISVVVMPQGKDPADVAAQDSEAWKELASKATTILEFFFSTAFAKFDKATAEGKKQISKELIPAIKKIPNKIEQAHWVRRLANELNVPEESVQQELRAFVPEFQDRFVEKEEQQSSVKKSRKELLEERSLALLFLRPAFLALVSDEHLSFLSLRMQEIVAGLRKAASFDFKELEGIFEQDMLQFLQYIAFQGEAQEPIEEQDMEQEFKSCLLELELLFVRSKLDLLAQAIRQAEGQQDVQLLEKLLAEFNELSRQLS